MISFQSQQLLLVNNQFDAFPRIVREKLAIVRATINHIAKSIV